MGDASNPRGTEDCEEDEIRTSLLSYYSSQCRDHTTYLLTMALVLLGSIQVAIAYAPRLRLMGLGIWLFAFITTRTLPRTLYWGYLANAIIVADEKKLVPDDSPVGEFEDKRLRTRRLHLAAVRYAVKQHSWAAWFVSAKCWEGWVLSGIAATVISGVLIYVYWELGVYLFYYLLPW